MTEITFKIKKHVQFGYAIFVIGSIIELGNWSPFESFRLQWTQNDFWVGSISISNKTLKQVKKIEYKYIVSFWGNPTQTYCQWILDINLLSPKTQISSFFIINSEQQWNFNIIKLYLIVKRQKSTVYHQNYKYSIIGNIPQLGNLKQIQNLSPQYNLNPNIIRKISQNLPKTDIIKFLKNQLQFQIHHTQIKIPRNQNKFTYYFIRNSQKLQIQRLPGRQYCQSQAKYPHRYQIIHQPGFISVFDSENFDKPTLSKITHQIYLGSFLKNQNDLKHLKQLGIGAIYSVQSQQDHERHGISPLYLELLCKEYEICYKTLDIKEKNSKDFVQKSLKAIQEIDQLIKKGKKTYVYCTEGKYCSPQIITLYLILKNGRKVGQALKQVRQKHPVARPCEKIIKKAIYHIKSIDEMQSKEIENISS